MKWNVESHVPSALVSSCTGEGGGVRTFLGYCDGEVALWLL